MKSGKPGTDEKNTKSDNRISGRGGRGRKIYHFSKYGIFENFIGVFSEEPSAEMKRIWGHTYKIYNEKGECEDSDYGEICLSTETGEWEEKTENGEKVWSLN